MKKTYTKKQITEAISYWKKQLGKLNESVVVNIPKIDEMAINAVKQWYGFGDNQADFYFVNTNDLESVKRGLTMAFAGMDTKNAEDRYNETFGNGALNIDAEECLRLMNDADSNGIVIAYYYQGSHKGDLDFYDNLKPDFSHIEYANNSRCHMMAFKVNIVSSN